LIVVWHRRKKGGDRSKAPGSDKISPRITLIFLTSEQASLCIASTNRLREIFFYVKTKNERSVMIFDDDTSDDRLREMSITAILHGKATRRSAPLTPSPYLPVAFSDR
jgi:hypothetical protein